MANIFMAGPDLVRWDVTALGPEGPYQLTVCHGHGTIVEYFHSTADALRREREIEELLTAARGAERLPSAASF